MLTLRYPRSTANPNPTMGATGHAPSLMRPTVPLRTQPCCGCLSAHSRSQLCKPDIVVHFELNRLLDVEARIFDLRNASWHLVEFVPCLLISHQIEPLVNRDLRNPLFPGSNLQQIARLFKGKSRYTLVVHRLHELLLGHWDRFAIVVLRKFLFCNFDCCCGEYLFDLLHDVSDGRLTIFTQFLPIMTGASCSLGPFCHCCTP